MGLGDRNPVRRDYYVLTCWTGRRRETVSGIAREHIDLTARTLYIPTPKGGRPFTLPLSDFLVQVIERRLAGNVADAKRREQKLSPWLFPAHSASGHISEPTANGGDGFTVAFTVHGLRNTYISACAAAGISPYHTKLLVNHAVPHGDVTAGYVGKDVEALRPSQEAVSRWLLARCAVSGYGAGMRTLVILGTICALWLLGGLLVQSGGRLFDTWTPGWQIVTDDSGVELWVRVPAEPR